MNSAEWFKKLRLPKDSKDKLKAHIAIFMTLLKAKIKKKKKIPDFLSLLFANHSISKGYGIFNSGYW